eukprot:7479719-Pyramimonas_sp.AAC.1
MDIIFCKFLLFGLQGEVLVPARVVWPLPPDDHLEVQEGAKEPLVKSKRLKSYPKTRAYMKKLVKEAGEPMDAAGPDPCEGDDGSEEEDDAGEEG